MVPSGGVVSGPGEAITLASGVGSAGENERTLVGPEFEQAFEGGAGILQPDDVVNLGVRGGSCDESGPFNVVHGIQRHGLAGSVKDRGFVHVVPETGNAILNKLVVEAAPPLAGLGASEVRKNRRTRPHDTDELGAIGILHKVVARFPGVVRRVALVGGVGDVQVSNVH